MRFNIDALSTILATNKAPDWEGRLCYKAPLSAGLLAIQPVFKERYFKLIGNLFFCEKEKDGRVEGVLVMEQFHVVRKELTASAIPGFFLVFSGVIEDQSQGGESRHEFVAESERSLTQWIEALEGCSYQKKREELILLQIRLRNKTGVDPLQGTSLRHNPIYYKGGRQELKDSLTSGEGGMKESSPGARKRQILLPPRRKTSSQSVPVQRKESFTSHIGIQNWERVRSVDVDQEDGKVVSSKKTGGIKVRVNPSFRSHLRSESNDKSQSEEDVELVSENLINL